MKKLLFLVILFSAAAVYSQSTISGSYLVGDKKASISADELTYYLIFEDENMSCLLLYEENTPENEQIWVVRYDGKHKATIIFKSDYSSGIYTDYRTGTESYVKKIQ